MKKLQILVLMLMIALIFTPDVLACGGWFGGGGWSGGGGGGATGAPLDGGLLAILAGAGITYFVARKKKNKDQ